MPLIFGSSGLAAILLIGAAAASAETPGMICGTATNPSGAGLAGVTVTLATVHATDTPASTTTDAAGNFLFTKVSVGTYTLSFTLDGFKKTVRSGLVISSGFELRVDQRLDRSSLANEVAPVSPVASVGYDRPRATGGVFTKEIVTSAPAPPPPHSCGAPR